MSGLRFCTNPTAGIFPRHPDTESETCPKCGWVTVPLEGRGRMITPDYPTPDPDDVRTDQPPSAERIAAATESAQRCFFHEVARLFPEVPFGDFDPLATVRVEEEFRSVVESWVEGNHPWHLAEFYADETEVD